ncbi:Integrase core domain protein [Labrenzia sp. THAF191b]|uniref:DDE-type integrase/transposase/recombinase n=1 Tax=unclassified Labrenzia TaxID=2648686 RepID=UPI001268B3A4|nr:MULTISPECIES: DDE-type integrase/transposase/recombinase [unclassified Labrenzia]QFS97591.1 Integrase core domain protein [Labrenzia sp. THAF191b]QFT03906.1 Integrase core domain protein [Labrenzia sp. THAF191a]QFT15448.1 Integrase core domain protein [Labrenzia sp. THAF187b]
MKLWLTAQEIADLKLDGFPASERGVQKLADREGWAGSCYARKRQGREGGGGFEYHTDLFPLTQKLQYCATFVELKDEDLILESSDDPEFDHRAERKRNAKLIVLRAAERFRAQTGLHQNASDHWFILIYAEKKVPVPDWVYATVKGLSLRSLARWRSQAEESQNRLAFHPAQSRKGTGVLDQAEQGTLKSYVLAAIFQQPHLKANVLRAMAEAKFGKQIEVVNPETGEVSKRDLPPLRTFQHTLKSWKLEFASALKRHTDPDGWKNTDRAVMIGGASAGIERLNQLWEIDASPVDMLTTEGRWNVYACIDVWSRRSIFLISCTPRADAVGLLVREAILKWGVPEAIKSDNGSDFKAKSTVRLLKHLDIEHLICPPYSPEQKPHVERVIKTFQHGFVELLPGFVGHNVAERSVIEGRKAFAKRLGLDDYNVFGVDVSPEELQEMANDWAENAYGRNPHGGLKKMSPEAKAATSTEKVLTVDPDALDVLLAAVPNGGGIRTVQKGGVRVDNEFYVMTDCAVMAGEQVLCRMDPKDLGRIWLFDAEGLTFLGHAICADLVGADPVETIARYRALQKAYMDEQVAPIKKAMKEIGPRDALKAVMNEERAQVLSFPQKREEHTTARTLAAADVKKRRAPRELSEREAAMMESLKADTLPQALQPTAKVHKLSKQHTPEALFKRALQLEQRLAEGTPISDEDAIWLAGFQAGPIYRAHKLVWEDTQHSQKRVPPAS